MPLVIIALGAGKHVHTNVVDKSNFKKPGTNLVQNLTLQIPLVKQSANQVLLERFFKASSVDKYLKL